MSLARDQRDWGDLALIDPMWAILSDARKRDGGWDQEAFEATGREDVERLLERADALGLPRRDGTVLDYGCGLGRLAPSLLRRFQEYLGLDISEEMVAAARDTHAALPNARFAVNSGERLAQVADGSVDMLHCRIVLQHVSSRAAIRSYLREFARVLAGGGLLVVQLPSSIPWRHRLQPRPRLYRALRRVGVPGDVLYRRLGLQPIRMRWMAVDEVRRLLEAEGIRLVAVDTEAVSGIRSSTYWGTR